MDATTLLAALINYGALGTVLAWHLWRTDRRLDRLERALERWARVQLLTVLAQHDVEATVREQVRHMLAELEQREGTS